MTRPTWWLVYVAGVIILVVLPFSAQHVVATIHVLFWTLVAVVMTYPD